MSTISFKQFYKTYSEEFEHPEVKSIHQHAKQLGMEFLTTQKRGRPGHIFVQEINRNSAPPGSGQAVLGALHNFADKLNKRVYLHPETKPEGQKKLEHYYKNLGYQPAKNTSDYNPDLDQDMWVRFPKQK